MKLRQLSWIFSIFFLFTISEKILESTDLKNILKEPVEQATQPGTVQTGKGKNFSQTTLVSFPEKSAVFSQSTTFNANVFATHLLDSIPTGNVQFKIDHVLVSTQPIIDGIAQFTITSLTTTFSNRHYIEAIYLGDDTFASSHSDMFFAVLPASTEAAIVAQPNPSTFGNPAHFAFNISPKSPATATPTGFVQFYIDAVNVGKANLDGNGKASFSTSDMLVGNHAITAIYQNNDNFIGSKADVVQQVEKANSTTQIRTLENPSLYGQTVNFQAKVFSNVGNPSGMMQFLVDGTNYHAPILLDGNSQASINIQNWASGSHTVQAYYMGDNDFNPSQASLNQQVNQAPTKLSIFSSDNPSIYGQSLGLTAKIESPTLPPVGYIQFRIDGKIYQPPQPLPRNGQVTINIGQLKAGNHEMVADYLGDENFISSSATLTQQIKRAKTTGLTSSENPSIYGNTIQITATVTTEEDLIPTGLVQFKINGKEFGRPQILKNGQSTLNISELDAGPYKIEVDYLGNENFSPSNASLVQQINKVKTDIEIYSINPSIYGEPVKVLATVSSVKLMPMGFVQFKLNGENYGEPQALSERGEAAMIFDKFQIGDYQIGAKYLGNQNFNSSNISSIQEVNKAETKTLIASSVNPVVLGNSVIFSATVSASEPTKGSIQFKIDGQDVGNPIIVDENNQASLTVSTGLKEGMQKIVAVFSGDKNFKPSTSLPLLQEARTTVFLPNGTQGSQDQTGTSLRVESK